MKGGHLCFVGVRGSRLSFVSEVDQRERENNFPLKVGGVLLLVAVASLCQVAGRMEQPHRGSFTPSI